MPQIDQRLSHALAVIIGAEYRPKLGRKSLPVLVVIALIAGKVLLMLLFRQ